MNYSTVPISEDALREAFGHSCNVDGADVLIFFKMRDGQRKEGILRDITSKGFSFLLLKKKDEHVQREAVSYEDVLQWAVLTKVEIAREYQKLANAFEFLGGEMIE
ncbi:MAG: hypothetical protein WC906_02270 [Parcubacteria group bacterium]|jgi:hypothetical protein